MQAAEQLRRILNRIEGRGYKAYKDLKGVYDFSDFTLSIDHVQGDPFAAPSRVSVQVSAQRSGLPAEFSSSPLRRIALGDYLTRAFDGAAHRITRGRRGTGKSGLIQIDCGGQEVLERSSIIADPRFVEARFSVGLPAAGRRVLARQAQEMLFEEVPGIVAGALYYQNLDAPELKEHILTVEDQEALRSQLRERGLVAFVAEGAVLPRRSGVDDRPLTAAAQGETVVPFQAPLSLRIELNRPNFGPIQGFGIPRGVTLIVGGGFHGKSTLLRALERSVYNHIPGDGREWVVTVESAVKIRAEDGRCVGNVDISPFIDNLPFGKSTSSFSTPNASGSTSQAANIIEALEMGAELLLIDEDTSASNFMIRDARMQNLVSKSREPITPFIDRAREIFESFGTSTILVMGGSGDYFEVADLTILMDEYRPVDVSEQVRQVVQAIPSKRISEGGEPFATIRPRYPRPRSFDARRGKRDVKIDAKGLKSILFGSTSIDLGGLEQLVDWSQTRALGEAILYFARHCAPPRLTLREGLEQLERDLDQNGLDRLTRFKTGNLARPRIFEIAAAINRMRSLETEQAKG